MFRTKSVVAMALLCAACMLLTTLHAGVASPPTDAGQVPFGPVGTEPAPPTPSADPAPEPMWDWNPWTTYNGSTVYHTFEEMETELFWIAENYPQITKLVSIGESWQGRDIWAMKVSDNPGVEEEGEPEIYFNANHHAREWMTIEITLYFLRYVTHFYGTNSTITDIVDDRQIWVIPCANPDGRTYDGSAAGDDPGNVSRDASSGWRKNVRDNDNSGTFTEGADGVDLNRNYGYLWGAAGATSLIGSDVYGGPYPFSEPETSAIRDFCRQHDFVFAISYHTSSQLILYPWGWAYEAAPDKDLFISVGSQMRSALTNKAGSVSPQYTLQQSSGLYPTAGSDDDWLYGELGIYAYCIEAYPSPSDSGEDISAPFDRFHPWQGKVIPVCQDNLPAAILLCRIADNPFQTMDHVSIAPSDAEAVVEAGASYNVEMTLTDDGRRADTFNLVKTNLAGWTISLSDSTMGLARNETRSFSLGVTVPPGTFPGTYAIWVNASSQTNSSCKDSSQIKIIVPHPEDAAAKALAPFVERGSFPLGNYRIDGVVKNVGESPLPPFNATLTIKELGVGSTQTLFQEGFESGLGQWSVIDHDLAVSSSVWKTSTTQEHNGTNSAWCGGTTQYARNTVQSLQMKQPLNLKKYTSATLKFWSYYSTQQYYDFCMVEGSPDNGKSWDYIARYDGSAASWQLRTLNLSPFLGSEQFTLRFRFTASNDDTVGSGFYLDDILINVVNPSENVVYDRVKNQTSEILCTGVEKELSWQYEFTKSGTFLAVLTTECANDDYAANNVTEVIFFIDGARTLPEFDGIRAVTNPGFGSRLSVVWDPGLQINAPLTYRAYRFGHAPSEAEVDAATPTWTGTSTSFDDYSVAVGQRYFYVVRATDALGQAEGNVISMSGVPGIAVDHWGPEGEQTVETRYLRGVANEAVVNGLTAYSLGLTNSNTAGNWGPANNVDIYLGIRVWKRSSMGVETEITSGTPVAQVARTAVGSGFQTATWAPPVTALATTDSIVVRVYGETSGPLTGTATMRAAFTTGQLGKNQIDAAQWTVQYWTRRGGAPNGSDWYWGTATYENKISGFSSSILGNPLDHNTLNWTASPSEVKDFNIYRSDSQSGPWDAAHRVATVGAETLTYCDMGKGQADSTFWWYVIRGVDGYGVEDTNANAVQEPGGSAPAWFNVTVQAGWNLVSVPLNGPTTMPGALADKTGGVVWTRAMWYNPSTPADPWKQYNSAWNPALNDLAAVGNTIGVWLYVTAVGDGQICVGGTGYSSPASTVVSLKAGWNLIGFPSDDAAYSLAQFKTDIAQPSAVVEQFNASATYRTSQMTTGNFTPGRAYWVWVPADSTWTKPY